jgi:hypothetical protein
MKPEISELVSDILDEDEFEEASALAQIYLKELDRYPFERFFAFDDKIGVSSRKRLRRDSLKCLKIDDK